MRNACSFCGRATPCSESDDVLAYCMAYSMLRKNGASLQGIGTERDAAPDEMRDHGESGA